MKCPHKNAEAIHAIADGKQTQWARNYKPNEWNDFDPVWDSSPISSSDEIIWRIKPPGVTQWRKDLAEAKKTGKIIQRFWFGEWMPCTYSEDDFLNGDLEIYPSGDFRIKPDPKPDVVSERRVELFNGSFSTHAIFDNNAMSGRPNNIRFIFDGETGEPKSAEALK